MDPISIGAGVVGLGGSIVSTILNAKEGKKQQDLLNSRYKQVNDWYNGEKNKDFLDTGVAKSAFSRIRQREKSQGEAANNNAAKGGATTDQALAAKSQINKDTGNTLSNLTQYGTHYKGQLRRDYFSRLRGLDAQQANVYNNRQKTFANVTSNSGSLMSGALDLMSNS